jgi:hypothetical protein
MGTKNDFHKFKIGKTHKNCLIQLADAIKSASQQLKGSLSIWTCRDV